MISIELLTVLLAGIPIGIFGVVFGGNMFLSFPLFQWLFPGMSVGAIVGNIKPCSVVRNVVALWPLRNEIDYRLVNSLLLPLGLGSIIGAAAITNLSQAFIIPILILGWLTFEFADRLSRFLTPSRLWFGATAVGAYGGIFGAGVSLILVSLLRLRDAEVKAMLHTRTDALYLETILTLISVGVFLSFGLIDWPIMLAWATGALLGGYLGGKLLTYTGTFSPQTQKRVVTVAFVIAIVVALWRI